MVVFFKGKRIRKIKDQRQKSVICLETQASRLTNKKCSKLEMGTLACVPIPDFDRTQISPRNLLAVIILCEYNMCTICKPILIWYYLFNFK